jgi:hypothetical protein
MARIDANGRYLISEIGLNYSLPFSNALMNGASAAARIPPMRRSAAPTLRPSGPVRDSHRCLQAIPSQFVLRARLSFVSL